MYHHVSILSQSGDVIITVKRVTSVALDYEAGILAAITKTGWVSLPLRLGETVEVRPQQY